MGSEMCIRDSSLPQGKYNITVALFEDNTFYRKFIRNPADIVILQGKNIVKFLNLIFGLRKVIKEKKPDTILSIMYPSNVISIISRRLSNRDCRLICCEHNYPTMYLKETHFGFIKKILMKTVYRNADIFVAISETIGNCLVKDFKVKKENLRIINNPVPVEDIELFAKEEVKHPFFDDEKNRVIISAGRFIKKKGFGKLINAFKKVVAASQNARLILLGEGELMEEIKHLVKQLNLEDFVFFAGFQANPYKWFSRAHVFVLASDYEGFPMVVLESLACGIPVITFKTPSGATDIIKNNKEGFIVPMDDIDCLSKKILELICNEYLLKQFSVSAKKRSLDFDVKKIMPQYDSIL